MKYYLLLGLTFSFSWLQAGEVKDLSTLKPFFQKYCYECHGSKKQKGDLRLDDLHYSIDRAEVMDKWKKIVESIDTYDMPPEDELEPSDDLREQTVMQINRALSVAIDKGYTQSSKVLRQLNKHQLKNSIRDLLDINVDFEDPTEQFPEHETNSYFNNTANKMKVTDFQLKKVLEIARTSIARAKYDGKKIEPRVIEKKFGEHDLVADFRSGVSLGKDFKTLMSGRAIRVFKNKREFLNNNRHEKVVELHPEGVMSTLTLDLEGFNARERMPDDLDMFYDVSTQNTPPVVGIYLHNGKDFEAGHLCLLEKIELKEGVRSKISRTFWLPTGYQVYLKYESSGFDKFKAKDLVKRFIGGEPLMTTAEYMKSIGKNPSGPGKWHLDIVKAYLKDFKPTLVAINKMNVDLSLPRLNLYHAKLEMGVYEEWPPKSHEELFDDKVSAEKRLHAFASKAFRRPLKKGELDPYINLMKSSEDGFTKALLAVMSSPSFLYIEEGDGELDDFAIASRLSYALWGSIPDQTLLDQAQKGKLKNKKELTHQIQRMLKDTKSRSILDDFVYQWLHLGNIDKMPPDKDLYSEYVRRDMQEDTLMETKLFFEYILKNNLSVSNLVNSDFTFLNARLAHLYGDKNFKGSLFHKKASVSHMKYRGGLLGQSSILTASANGVDTSPILRGIWMLENIFGITPPPPPPNTEAIPDARGAESIRDLLKKHRSEMSCSRCHSKIDPLGFALENFDAVGQWRDRYDENQKVDASGRYAGHTFKDLLGLKKYLSTQTDVIAETVLKKFLTYATAREMQANDKLIIHDLMKDVKSKEYRLKDLIVIALTSPIFLER